MTPANDVNIYAIDKSDSVTCSILNMIGHGKSGGKNTPITGELNAEKVIHFTMSDNVRPNETAFFFTTVIGRFSLKPASRARVKYPGI